MRSGDRGLRHYSPVTESGCRRRLSDHGRRLIGLRPRHHRAQGGRAACGGSREAERGRIARALHDDALQGLSDAIALVAMAERTTAESPLAGQLLPVLRRVGEQLRSAIYDLYSGSEEQTPFVELLARLVDEHRAMVGNCEIQLEIGDGVPAGSFGVKGVEVLRILGEALSQRASPRAGRARSGPRVGRAATGCGSRSQTTAEGLISPRPAPPIHRGITEMRERAELLNGRLEIYSEPGVGTSLRLEAPLANATR